ncbi:maestro heat-like repeat-containing protein family member 7 [Paroedura picta]|uniref:maestro heat-like repeat-containing protein family member 7 n=1 Tax=Paroedura picta TaxID=143630 RepID=UPI004057ADB3
MSGFLWKSGTMVGTNEEGDVVVSTSGNRKPMLDETPTTSPHKSWFLLCKEKKEVCKQAGEKLKNICECCTCNKISPQECTSQEALEITTMKSSIFTISTASFMDSCSTATIPKEEEVSLADDSCVTILEHIKHLEKAESYHFHGFQEKFLNISFLSSISALSREAEEKGLGESQLPHSKAILAEYVMMMMANLPEQSVPNTTLICAMFAIQNLSKIKTPLPPDVESGVLRFALQGVLSADIEDSNPHNQALYKTSIDTLQAMLKGLLEEEPTTGHILFILEHINFWIKSRDPKEKARAQKVNTALLQHMMLSQHFDDFDDHPLLGRHVAELALCLTDTSQDVNEQAREGIMCLYNVLLNRNVHTIETPWCQQKENNKEILGYIDVSKVGQMFAKIFNQQQRRSFLQTSLLAIYNPLPRIREAAVLLIYSLLGREKELLGKEVKEVKTKIVKAIHKLETGTDVTDLLQGLLPNQGQLIMEDIENTEEF